MQRLLIETTLLLIGLSAGSACTLQAQTLPTKKEAEVILEDAAKAADLWADNSLPFHLSASVHYELAGQPSDGTYDLLWMSADRYREYFAMRSAKEMEIASGGKLSILRNTSTPTLPSWTTRQTLRFIKNYFLRQKVKRVHPVQVSGIQTSCIDSENNFAERQDCFDSITNRVVSVSFVEKLSGRLNSVLVKSELTRFTSLGEKRYPLRIITKELDEKLDVEITTLEQPQSVPEDAFTSPPDAQTFDWCPSPTAIGHIEFPSRPVGLINAPGGTFPYYVLVGRDGHVKKSAPMRSAGRLIDERMASWLGMSKFPIHSCGGNPVEYETVFIAPLELRLPYY